MAIKTPLVLYDGKIMQVQSGDSVEASATGVIDTFTNGEAGSITFGMPVYSSDSDEVKKARANSGTLAQAVGVVYDASVSSSGTGQVITSGVIEASNPIYWNTPTDGEGMVAGTTYFLSDATAGIMTSTAPTSGYITIMGEGLSSTKFLVRVQEPIKL